MPKIIQDSNFTEALNVFQATPNYQIDTNDRVEIRKAYNFNDYIESIRIGGWGGNIELVAITQLYGMQVILLNNNNYEISHDPPGPISENLGELKLRFHYTGSHYNVFVEEPAQPPSQLGGRSKKSKRSKNKKNNKTSRKNIKTSKKKNSKMKKYNK